MRKEGLYMEKVSAWFQKKENREIKKETKWGPWGNCLIKGWMIAIGISLLALFVYAIILANTEVAESTMPTVIIVVTAVSLLAGSMIATRKMESKGILTGLGIGLAYMGSMYLLSSIALTELVFSSATIVMLLIGMVFSAIGGIIGVNF